MRRNAKAEGEMGPRPRATSIEMRWRRLQRCAHRHTGPRHWQMRREGVRHEGNGQWMRFTPGPFCKAELRHGRESAKLYEAMWCENDGFTEGGFR